MIRVKLKLEREVTITQEAVIELDLPEYQVEALESSDSKVNYAAETMLRLYLTSINFPIMWTETDHDNEDIKLSLVEPRQSNQPKNVFLDGEEYDEELPPFDYYQKGDG